MTHPILQYTSATGPSKAVRFWIGITRWPLLLGSAVLAVALPVAGMLSPSFDSYVVLFISVVAGLPTMVLWLIRLKVHRLDPRPRWFLRPTLAPLLLVSAALVGFALGAVDAGRKLSLPFMDRLAVRTMALPPGVSMPPDQRCGLVRAYDVQRIDGGIAFRSNYGGILDWCGYAYHPGGPPASTTTNPAVPPEFYFGKHIGGDWYEVDKY